MCNMAEDCLVTEDPDPVVVDQNGEAYERPHLAPKSKLTVNEYSVASIINLGSRRESDCDIDRDIIARVSKAIASMEKESRRKD